MKNVNNNALTFEQRIEAQKTIDQRKSTLSRYGTVLLFFGPYLFFFCLFFVYPIIQGVINSFYSYNFGNPDRIFVGWQNYHDIIIGNADIATYKTYFDEGLLHTLYFVLLTVPFLIVAPFILALLLNQKPWGESFFRALFFLPNVLSVSTVCILFRYVFNPERGLIKGFNFESDLASAWFVLVIVTVWWTVGNNMVIMNAGLKQVDKSLYEAASIDGCSPFKQIFYVTLPQIGNQILVCTITTFIASFNVYGQVDLITNGGPNEQTMVFIQRVLQLIHTSSLRSGTAGIASAMCVLFALLIVAISLIQLYVTKDKSNSHRRIFKKQHAYVKEGAK